MFIDSNIDEENNLQYFRRQSATQAREKICAFYREVNVNDRTYQNEF